MGREVGWRLTAQAVTIAAGVSIGVMGAAAVADADTGAATDSGSASVSTPGNSGVQHGSKREKATSTGRGKRKQAVGKAAESDDTAGPDASEKRVDSQKPEETETADTADKTDTDTADTADKTDTGTADTADTADKTDKAGTDSPTGTETPSGTDTPATAIADDHPTRPARKRAVAAPAVKPAEAATGEPAAVVTAPATPETPATPAAAVVTAATEKNTRAVPMVASVAEPAESRAAETGTTMLVATAARATLTAAAPKPTLIGTITAVIFGVVTALERLLTGPATVPAGSNVTVRSSSLQIDSQTVPADWYFPASDEPPQRIILLQHGFFAIGTMYSTTAARLAEKTNSIVVVPTITSNPLADGGLWINGAPMQQAVARLFIGDRAALNASALAAGYAKQYGLDPADAVLPAPFVLAGHSAGGALVSVAAGYLVDHDAADDLMGVLLLDAVTADGQLSSTLTKLAAYQEQTGRYIPVREIGAPPSAWNSISNVNSALSNARPDRFNGVVLAGGVHTDSMGGASALSQFLVQLIAGFPTAQNPAALRQLAADWVNDWFAGRTDVGDSIAHGSTITVTTGAGTATGRVIGTAPAVAETALVA